MDKKNIEDIFALTPMQEGMLSHYLKNPGSDLNFEQLSLVISGEFDAKRIETAWNFVIETNEMLRAVFRWEKVRNPVQIILKKHKLQPVYHDVSDKAPALKKTLLEELKVKDRTVKFDLREVPFRVTLCKIADTRYEMIISNHHILFDGWSMGIILNEFFQTYNCLFKENHLLEPPVKTKFRRFVQWTQQQDTHKQEEFWKNYLNGFNRNTAIPLKRRKRKEIKSPGYYQLRLPGNLKNESENFIKSHNITVASFLYSVWGILLQRYNSTDDVLFDTTVSGRSAKIGGIENMVGLFINTLPLRVQTLPHEKISEFLSRIHHTQQQREEFANRSLKSINEYLDERRGESLFDSLLVIENYPLSIQPMLTREKKNSAPKLTLDSFSYSTRTFYDLTVIVTIFDHIMLSVTYNTGLFDEEILEKLVQQFILILKKMITAPGQNVSQLAPLLGKVKEKLVARYEMNLPQPGARYAAPQDKVEEKLVTLWAELFRVDTSTVSIDANFYDLGGHSLTASLLTVKVISEFQVIVPLAEIFKHPSIRQLSRYIIECGRKKQKSAFIEPSEKKDYYVLSSAARRIFTFQQVYPDSKAYNACWAMVLEGVPGKKQFENFFKQLINRHENLRTSFMIVNGQPVQRIHDEVEFKVEYYEQEGNLIQNHVFIRHFDLSSAPLLRVGLIKIDEGKHIFIVDMHHIITDGLSTGILIREFVSLYKGETLLQQRIQYKDFSEWQYEQIKSGKFNSQKEYWLKHFQGELPVLNMPTDYPRPLVQSLEGDKIKFRLEKQLQRDLHALMRETGTTLYMTLMAVLAVLLSKYTDQCDIIIGSPFAGRYHPDLNNMIGLVVETLVIRNDVPGDKPFEFFLKQVKENILAAYENQPYPYGELTKQLELKNDLSRNPLFDVMLNVREQETFEFTITGLRFIPFRVDLQVSQCDLILEVINREEEMAGIEFELGYCSRLFKRESLERFSGFFINIMRQVVRNPAMPISRLEMLNKEENRQIAQNGRSQLAADFDF